MVEHFPGMEEVVGSIPRGGRNFSHGKFSKITIIPVFRRVTQVQLQLQRTIHCLTVGPLSHLITS